MAPRSGIASQLTSPVAESTYGVAPTLTGAKFSAFKSETLKLTKVPVQGEGILAGKLYPQAVRRVVPEWTAGGGIVMDLPLRGLQQWLFPMFGSYGQTASALTQNGTTGSYTAVHAAGGLEGNSFALQKGVPTADNGTIEPVTYVGCKITDWELAVAKSSIAQLTLTVDARNELAGTMNGDPLNGSLPGLVTYAAPAAGSVFHFAQASLFTGGTCSTASGVTTVASPVLAGNVRSASIKHAVPLDTTDRYFMGNAGFKAEQYQNGLRQITGQIVVEWLSSEALYNAYAADTLTTLQLQFVGAITGTSGTNHATLTILIPDIALEGDSPQTPGLDVVVQTIPFTGLDDGTNNVIQATYITADSA